MKTKKKTIIASVMILAVVLFAVYLYMSESNNSYSITLKANWGISIPYGGEIIFEKEVPEVSFNGDGERYRVYQYDEEPVFDKNIEWSDKLINQSRLTQITENVKPDYEPDIAAGANRYFYLTGDNDTRDKLWLIFDEETKMLYVVEDFF